MSPNMREKWRISFPFSDHEHNEDGPINDPNTWKIFFVTVTTELIGTVMWLWFAFAGHLFALDQGRPVPGATMARQNAETVIYIALSYVFSLLATTWAWYKKSGDFFNPAVTLGKFLARKLSWLRALALVPAQILGAMAAAALVDYMFPGRIQFVETRLSSDTSIARGRSVHILRVLSIH